MELTQYPVVINPYGSVRRDFTPTSGTLTVEATGQLILQTSPDNVTLLAKPLNQITSVQFRGLTKNSSLPFYVYSSANEAYEITFGSSTGAGTPFEILAQLKSGNLQAATDAFKQAQANQQANNAQLKQAVMQSSQARDTFIRLATNAGVYTPYKKSLSGIMSIVIAASIIGLLAAIYFIAK